MTVVLLVAFLYLIFTNHILLAFGLAVVAAVAFFAWEVWRAPLMPELDEERDQ